MIMKSGSLIGFFFSGLDHESDTFVDCNENLVIIDCGGFG
jgi:hypothetical protein